MDFTHNRHLFSASLPIVVLIISVLLFPGKSAAQEAEYHIGPRDVLTLTIYAGGEKQQQV
ncbi:MAG: hypothetical protein IME97_04595, partial [Proteobacteria bacterium]|nr:hypothetical protein [Pseudomonadota bacterium]